MALGQKERLRGYRFWFIFPFSSFFFFFFLRYPALSLFDIFEEGTLVISYACFQKKPEKRYQLWAFAVGFKGPSQVQLDVLGLKTFSVLQKRLKKWIKSPWYVMLFPNNYSWWISLLSCQKQPFWCPKTAWFQRLLKFVYRLRSKPHQILCQNIPWTF